MIKTLLKLNNTSQKEIALQKQRDTTDQLAEELKIAYIDFNEVTEQELIDACIYRINSLERALSHNVNYSKNTAKQIAN